MSSVLDVDSLEIEDGRSDLPTQDYNSAFLSEIFNRLLSLANPSSNLEGWSMEAHDFISSLQSCGLDTLENASRKPE